MLAGQVVAKEAYQGLRRATQGDLPKPTTVDVAEVEQERQVPVLVMEMAEMVGQDTIALFPVHRNIMAQGVAAHAEAPVPLALEIR